jgi:hypothetical protein
MHPLLGATARVRVQGRHLRIATLLCGSSTADIVGGLIDARPCVVVHRNPIRCGGGRRRIECGSLGIVRQRGAFALPYASTGGNGLRQVCSHSSQGSSACSLPPRGTRASCCVVGRAATAPGQDRCYCDRAGSRSGQGCPRVHASPLLFADIILTRGRHCISAISLAAATWENTWEPHVIRGGCTTPVSAHRLFHRQDGLTRATTASSSAGSETWLRADATSCQNPRVSMAVEDVTCH